MKRVLLIMAACTSLVSGLTELASDRVNSLYGKVLVLSVTARGAVLFSIQTVYAVASEFCHCKLMVKLLITKTRTEEDVALLRKSACGFDGTTPKVCCQQSCYTPEGLHGNCIDIHECPHLADKIRKPLGADVITHIRQFRCYGTSHHSVCCRPKTTNHDHITRYDSYCNSSNQAVISPPEPSSECCGTDLDDYKILDGEFARILQHPWTALIEYEKDGKIKLLCGGALISSKYVLTAAQCIEGPILESGIPKNVRLGEYDTSNDGKDCTQEAYFYDCTDAPVTIPIERAIVHRDYDAVTTRNDIALIRMKKITSFTDFIRPICMPTTDVTADPPKHYRLTTAGWGAYNETIRKSVVKLQVQLRLVDKQQCQSAFSKPGRQHTLWDKQVCAEGKQSLDSCKADVGGPLMYVNSDTNQVELIGLFSAGLKPCGPEPLPMIYTKVFEYKKWIHNTISLWK